MQMTYSKLLKSTKMQTQNKGELNMTNYNQFLGQTVSFVLTDLSIHRGVLQSVQEHVLEIDGKFYPIQNIVTLRLPVTKERNLYIQQKSFGRSHGKKRAVQTGNDQRTI